VDSFHDEQTFDTLGCGRYAADLRENREIYIPTGIQRRHNFAKKFRLVLGTL